MTEKEKYAHRLSLAQGLAEEIIRNLEARREKEEPREVDLRAVNLAIENLRLAYGWLR